MIVLVTGKNGDEGARVDTIFHFPIIGLGDFYKRLMVANPTVHGLIWTRFYGNPQE